MISEIPSELQDARRSENSGKVRKDIGKRYHNYIESEDINSMDELKLSIFEACENDEIDVVTRDSMLEAITEGANIELIKHKLQTRKVYKEKIKEIKKAIKNKEYDKATDAIDDLIKEIETAIDEINDIDKSDASAIFSMLTASCANVGRTVVALLLAVPTLGISCTVAGLSQLLENISGLVNAHKKHGSLQLSDWNAYFNQVENLYLKYIRVLNALKRDVKKHATEEKKMEPEKENKKPETKKPDKKDETKKDKPIPTVESVIDAMFEASDQGKLSDEEKSILIQYIRDKHFH